MADDFTILNPGSGGDVMDEESVSFATTPTIRKRERIQVTGATAPEISRVINTNPTGSEYGLVVRPIVDGYPGDPIFEYSEVTLVPSSSETTVVTYTVPVGKTFHFIGINSTGDIPARFRLFVDGVPKMAGRTSITTPNFMSVFAQAPFTLAAGLTVSLKATHFFGGMMGKFEATLTGYIV